MDSIIRMYSELELNLRKLGTKNEAKIKSIKWYHFNGKLKKELIKENILIAELLKGPLSVTAIPDDLYIKMGY